MTRVVVVVVGAWLLCCSWHACVESREVRSSPISPVGRVQARTAASMRSALIGAAAAAAAAATATTSGAGGRPGLVAAAAASAAAPTVPAVPTSTTAPTLASAAVAEDSGLLNGLISGAATRISKELLLHPIDTVRARQQVPPSFVRDDNSQKGPWDGLYDGIVPALVGGVPAGALFFGVKDYSKKRLKKMGFNKEQATVASVTLANVLYWVVRNPAEVRKTAEQIGSDSQSSVEAVRQVYIDGGAQGVAASLASSYSSYPSNFVYALPADIIKFLAYEALTAALYGKAEGEKVEGLQAAVTGAAAGLIAQAATTPLDVARTRIMVRAGGRTDADAEPSNTNPVTEIIDIVDSEGVAALFAGLLPRATRAVASGAIQFASYELTQNALTKR